MEEKVKLIDEIVKRHPSYGIKNGWSWYVGGMRDTGDWYYRKMLDVSIEDLQSFLDVIIEGENKPKIEPTEEELADSKIIYQIGNSWINGAGKKAYEKFQLDCKRLMFGL